MALKFLSDGGSSCMTDLAVVVARPVEQGYFSVGAAPRGVPNGRDAGAPDRRR